MGIKERIKKNKMSYIIVTVWIILYVMGGITIERLIRFVIIMLIVVIYTRVLLKLEKKDDVLDRIYKERIEKKKGIKGLNKIYKLLIIINKYKNPVIWILCKIENRSFSIMRKVTYRYKENPKIKYLIYVILKGMTNPFIIILNKYYKTIIKWKSLTLKEIIFKRMYGLILSVLIFTNIMEIIKYYLEWKIIIIIICMIFLWLGMIEFTSVVKIKKEYGYVYNLMGKILLKMRKITLEIDGRLDWVLDQREENTWMGVLLHHWSRSIMRLGIEVEIKKEYIYYMDSFSVSIEEGFYKWWELEKIAVMYYYKKLEKEYKNKPSFYLYHKLYAWIEEPLEDISELYFMKKYWDISKKENREEIRREIEYINEYDRLRIKVLIFLIWDIESYVGSEDYSNFKQREINEEISLSWSYESAIYGRFDPESFKIEKEEENKFYDIEENKEYYNKLYLLTCNRDISNRKGDKVYREYKAKCQMDLMMSEYGEALGKGRREAWEEVTKTMSEYIKNLREEWEELKKRRPEIKRRNERLLEELSSVLEKEIEKIKGEKLNKIIG